MSIRSALLFGVICLGFIAGPYSYGAPPAAPEAKSARTDQPIRTDRYGDPLPPGAVARLGTERLMLFNSMLLAFSPDGRHVAAHNRSNQLRVWETTSGKELLRVTTPAWMDMRPLVFSPDSKLIALSCPNERGRGRQPASVRVWEVATGKERHCLGGFGFTGRMDHLAFSPDGRYLFAGGYEAPLLRWALIDGGTPKEYGNLRLVTFLALSRDGKTLTAVTRDRQDPRERIFIRWDTASGKEIGRNTFTTPGYWDGSLSPDGSVFAVPDADGKSIALLDPFTGRELSRAHESVSPGRVSFSADGTAMTCSTGDGTVRVWDTATGKLRTRFKALSTSVRWIALSPDGKLLALTGRADDAVHLWDVAAGRELHSFVGHRGGPLTFAFLPDGKEIATVSRDGGRSTPMFAWADWSLRRWDAATGTELAVTSADLKGEVWHTSFSADGRRLATVSYDGTLRLWDVESGKTLRSWKVFQQVISDPAFSRDGKTLLAAQGPKIHRWEVATGRELPAFEIEWMRQDYSWCLPSPDGRTLIVSRLGDRDPAVLLLDAASGKVKQRLKVGPVWPRNSAFSPDGRTLAFVYRGEVLLWEVASGRSRARLPVPRGDFTLAFSPDGRFLAFGGTDEESPLCLWGLATGQVVGRLRDYHGPVTQLAFSPNGSRLAMICGTPIVLVCDVAALCDKKRYEEIVNSTILSAEELEGLWAELSGTDGARAYRAIRRLGLSGPRGVAFLKGRLKGDKPPDEQRIARLIADLDADKFTTREKATAELEKLGVRAEPALRRALEGEASAEARSRIKRLLERLGGTLGEPPPTPELIRQRVVEALEANGTREARQALAELSEHATEEPLRQEAKASLERLSRRPAP